MFNLALSLISSLQAGARIKQSFERSLRQAVNAAIAAVVLIAAAAFGLIAAYHALIAVYGFLAGLLALLGLLILLLLRAPVHKAEREVPQTFESAGQGLGLIDQGLGKAMQQTGPLTLLALAFVAGILAGRRK